MVYVVVAVVAFHAVDFVCQRREPVHLIDAAGNDRKYYRPYEAALPDPARIVNVIPASAVIIIIIVPAFSRPAAEFRPAVRTEQCAVVDFRAAFVTIHYLPLFPLYILTHTSIPVKLFSACPLHYLDSTLKFHFSF